jgi:heat shock protein 5
MSAALEGPLLGIEVVPHVPALDAILCLTAVTTWAVFDGSRQGIFMAVLTAVAGPALEYLLITQGHLYSYSHPQIFGVLPSWMGWTYFAGGPSVGNLGRKAAAILKSRGLTEE